MGHPPEHRQVMPGGLGVGLGVGGPWGGPWGNGLDEGPRVALGIPRGILSRETRGQLINKRPTVSGLESPPAMHTTGFAVIFKTETARHKLAAKTTLIPPRDLPR